ncbi:hypothetical protein MW887_010014 [Aspergillus wentii]|nr:hypothetical protein MW887_010014 [Aspergillus wentii]
MLVESLVRGDGPAQPEPPALSTAESGISSLAAVTAEAPYRPPARLDLARLERLIAAKRSASQDHLLSLREDPSYFADVVLDTKEHRKELLPDNMGRRHSSVRPYPKKTFWDRVLRSVVVDSYENVIFWDCLLDQITHLQALLDKSKDDIAPDKDLPLELLEQFLDFHYSLHLFTQSPISKLRKIVTSSPPLRSQCVRLQDDDDPSPYLRDRENGHEEQTMATFDVDVRGSVSFQIAVHGNFTYAYGRNGSIN